MLGVVWPLLGAACAQPRPDVALWVEGDSVTAGAPFVLNIESSTPAHRGIAFPAAADSVFGDVEVLDRSEVYTRGVGGGYAIDSVSYTMRTFARDSVRIPPVPVRVDVAVGTLTTHTEPYTVWVRSGRDGTFFTSVLADRGTGVGQWGLRALIGIGGFCGGAYLWGTFRNNTSSSQQDSERPATVSDPHEAAAQHVRALQSRDLSTPEAVETFYVDLSTVVCTYLSRRLSITTAERTTSELVTVLDRRADVPAEAVAALRAALEQSDLVKFAAARPDPDTAKDTAQSVQKGIDAIEDAVAESASERTTA